MKFTELGLVPEILRSVADQGYETPTPIQQQAIPLVLAVTFLAMHYLGIGLHKVSLGSLIIALGLLVGERLAKELKKVA